jgi:sulfate transport system permease protein
VAWVLVRYRFPGRLIDALVDLPFALPTAVAGIALTAARAQRAGSAAPLADHRHPRSPTRASASLIALVFIGLPFVVRTVQPVLEGARARARGGAATLGASALADLRPGWCCRRSRRRCSPASRSLRARLGEYGSVVFIAGNMPMSTEITPLLIMTKLEQYDYAGATALALVMLAASFALLFFASTCCRRGAGGAGRRCSGGRRDGRYRPRGWSAAPPRRPPSAPTEPTLGPAAA